VAERRAPSGPAVIAALCCVFGTIVAPRPTAAVAVLAAAVAFAGARRMVSAILIVGIVAVALGGPFERSDRAAPTEVRQSR
jgi:predicted anti-sigma-YlaC factor YlaD